MSIPLQFIITISHSQCKHCFFIENFSKDLARIVEVIMTIQHI